MADIPGQQSSLPDPQNRAFFYRYLHIPHVTYRDRAGRSFSDTDGEMPCSPRPPDAFQRDLHKRIEDYGKRHHHRNDNSLKRPGP